MSRRRDDEDNARWAAQARQKKARVDAWLVGRTDGGVPKKPTISGRVLKNVGPVNDPFGGNNYGGEIDVHGALCVHFKARAIGELEDPKVVSIDCRMLLSGDPRNMWEEWTPVTLTERELVELQTLIVAAIVAQRREAEAWSVATASSDSDFRPWNPGSTYRPGSPHLDPRDLDYYSREAVQERASEKALMREGRERYDDDWYPGRYVN